MKGVHKLTIQSVYLKYELVFSRNLTILQGNSATGKTTLVDMIQEYILNGSDTGIQLSCDCGYAVIAGNTWKSQLNLVENSIVFIDEGNQFVATEDFARTIQGSSNYYVIITRENLSMLPYSITEIYGIRSSGKYGSIEPVYHHMYRIYEKNLLNEDSYSKILLIEDSNSGYDFFHEISTDPETRCISAGGSSRIFDCLSAIDPEHSVTVIADGAAFGPQMGKVWQLILRRGNIRLYLPESFEWIILSSGILDDTEVHDILNNPADFIDSALYFSWERYFTKLLTEKTNNTWMRYNKSKLNPVFVQGKMRKRIIDSLPDKIRKLFL